MSNPRTFTTVALAVMLLLAGCAGFGGGDGAALADDENSLGDAGSPENDDASGENEVALRMQDVQQPPGGEDGASGEGSVDEEADGEVVPPSELENVGRSIVREGTYTLSVDNFTSARQAIVRFVEETGGYVADGNQQLHRDGEDTWRTGYVVLRVPSSEYGAVRERVSEQGTVVSQRTETKDVTDQLVDLDARLTNLKERRDRLREFYDRANGTDELLRIERELSQVQGEIERVEAKKQTLERRVSYSKVRVNVEETPPETEAVQPEYHEQSLTAAFTGSLEDMYEHGRGLLVTGVSLSPWAALAAVPVLLLRTAYRRRLLPSVRSLIPFAPSTGDSTADADDAETAENGTDVDRGKTDGDG